MAITHYSDKSFCIDLVSETYKTTDAVLICEKAKEVLSIDITVSDVLDFFNHTEDFEKASNSIHMREIFTEQIVI